jgi:serine protease Do
MVRSISQQIITNGKVEHGYLGISMNDVTPDNARFFQLKDASGAIVAEVTPDSPAANAGLKQGDVIRSLNGREVLNGSALQVAVSEDRPGTKIELGVLRNGQTVNINLTVGEYHAKGEVQTADNSDGPSGGKQTGKLGLAVANLDGDTRQQLNVPSSVKGAVVQNVRPGSAADDAGLQPGDIILEVNRKSTPSADAFVSTVKSSTDNRDLLLLVWSHGNASYRTLRGDSNQNG